MKEQFKTFLLQLSETNATLDYFVDFEKVKGNVRKIALKLKIKFQSYFFMIRMQELLYLDIFLQYIF